MNVCNNCNITTFEPCNSKMVNSTRLLWEEVFTEDSEEFIDYYYKCKIPNNKGFIIEDDGICNAMLFLTPNNLCVHSTKINSYYIVGVATRMEYRHRGCMSKLLRVSLDMTYSEEIPFIYLMPADPAIYRPFQFEYIYTRDIWELGTHIDYDSLSLMAINQNMKVDIDGYILKCLKVEECEDAALYAMRVLSQRYSTYVVRDREYYELALAQIRVQNGAIIVLEHEGEIRGLITYALDEGKADIQEVILENEDIERGYFVVSVDKKPIIMARITNIYKFVESLTSDIRSEHIIKIDDPMISDNSGTFKLVCDVDGCSLSKSCEIEEALTGIDKLMQFTYGQISCEQAFQVCNGCDSDIFYSDMKSIVGACKACINEIV